MPIDRRKFLGSCVGAVGALTRLPKVYLPKAAIAAKVPGLVALGPTQGIA